MLRRSVAPPAAHDSRRSSSFSREVAITYGDRLDRARHPLNVRRFWRWLLWRPSTYSEAALFALGFGLLTMAIVWATRGHQLGQAVVWGVVVALLNLAARAARIWDRRESQD